MATPFGSNLHPPIDRILLKGLAASDRVHSAHKKGWGQLNWTQLDEASYYALIGELRAALPSGAPFWTIEEYWDPSRDGT